MPTIEADFGDIIIDENTITLKRKDGQVFEWPPRFKNAPRQDTINRSDAAQLEIEGRNYDKWLSAVVYEVVKRDAKYLNHPVGRRWIEHNQETIALVRQKGKP